MNFRELMATIFAGKQKPKRGPKPKYTYEHVGNEPHFHKKVPNGKRPKVVMVAIKRAHLIDYSKAARRARGELPVN